MENLKTSSGTNTHAASTLPWASYNQIANYLIRDGVHYNLDDTGAAAKSGKIRYNLSGWSDDYNGLTSDGKKLARAALSLYEEVLGIDFVETTSFNADLYFRDNDEGAYSTWDTWGNTGHIDYAKVNVSANWLLDDGGGIGTYSFQTYVHEIGHALGLGHPGPYNGEINFVTSTLDPDYGNNSNIFLNDSWQASIMSYLDQKENTKIDASKANPISTMVADWKALDKLYSISDSAFSGNTVWGFNTNVTNAVFKGLSDYADQNAFTIVDADGTDKIDFSGFGDNQKIDLRETEASHIGGLKGNMLIAGGTIIENARSGKGDDTLRGNDADNKLVSGSGADILWGSNGADTLLGGDGKDELYGEKGADTLNGGPGADKLRGGAGDDTYYADNAKENLSENSGNGNDTVIASTSFKLGRYFENLTLANGAKNGTGNGSDNVLKGNGADNRLDGRAGRDDLLGQEGRDTLSGGDGADNLTGGRGNDKLLGNGGNDDLTGGKGKDLMRGGGGSDTFHFTGTGDSSAGKDRDQIETFTRGEDLIALNEIDANSTRSGNQKFTWIDDADFSGTPGELRFRNGVVKANTDGDGIADFSIAVDVASLSESDFIL